MPELHLRQPGFIYSACGSLTKSNERIQKFKETGDSRYIYQNELDEACFQHHMAYGDFKYLTRKTTSDKILRDKVFNIAKTSKYDGISWRITKLINRKFKKRKVPSPFIDNIWCVDLADIQLINQFNKEIIFLSCVIKIYSKYAWVIPLKNKLGITITNVFQKILKESNRKPNKIWVHKGS